MPGQPTSPIALIFCGLPFSGKTTFAKALAQATGWTRIDLDEINNSRGAGHDGNAVTPDEWTETYDESYRLLETALRSGASVIYDQVNHLKPMRERLRGIALASGAQPLVLHFDIPAEVCIARWKANRLTGDRYDVRDEDFMNVVNNFEPPGADENPLVVTGSDTAETWFDAVLRPIIARA